MYLNAKDNPWKAAMFFVWDLDTNKIISHVLWANDETGEYAQWLYDEFDEIIYDEETDEPLLQIKKGNIKLKEKEHGRINNL